MDSKALELAIDLYADKPIASDLTPDESQPEPPQAAPHSERRAQFLAWMARTGIVPTDEQIAMAEEKLGANGEAPYKADVMADVCPVCFGSGAVKAKPGAMPTDSEFGKVKPCPHKSHIPERQGLAAKISGLTVNELNISLDDLGEYYDDDPGNEYQLPDGHTVTVKKRILSRVPRSNRAMLSTFRQMVEAPNKYNFVYVWGPWGNGKTTAGMGLVNDINKANKGPAVYKPLPDLLQFIKDAFDERNKQGEFGGWSESRRYETLVNAPVLVVDEFDFDQSKTQVTEYNLSLLQRFINERYRLACSNKAVTVLLSNSPVEFLGIDHIKSRLLDRNSRVIINSAPDFRSGDEDLF